MSSFDHTNYIARGIFVRPLVSAVVFEGTPFAFIGDQAPPDRDLCIVPPNHGDEYSVIESVRPDGTKDPEGIAAQLTELLTHLGDGYTYTGDLTIESAEGDGPEETFRLRVVQHPAEGDQPARLSVVRDDAVLIFPADYAIPAGPAVTFDADAARAWLDRTLADPDARIGYNLHPDAPYTYDESPGDWLARLLPDLSDFAAAPQVWRTARRVAVETVETISPEGMVADGGVMMKVIVGGLILVSDYLSLDTLASRDLDNDGRTSKTQLDAVVEALDTAAATVNRLVEDHRTVRAADAHVSSPLAALGTLTQQVGADNVECALIALAELVRSGAVRVDEHDVLSERQRMVASLVCDRYEEHLAAALGDDNG